MVLPLSKSRLVRKTRQLRYDYRMPSGQMRRRHSLLRLWNGGVRPAHHRAPDAHLRGGRGKRASREERLRRNASTFRLAEKPTKRDLEASRRHLLDADSRYRLNSAGKFEGRSDYLRIENDDVEPVAAAERIIEAFGLPRAKR
jgi:hypothetical protein